MDSVLHLLIKFFVVTQFHQATDCQFMESGSGSTSSGSGVLVTTDIPTNDTCEFIETWFPTSYKNPRNMLSLQIFYYYRNVIFYEYYTVSIGIYRYL